MKRLTKKELADKIEEAGLLYELQGVAFKSWAYARAADQIASFGLRITDLYKEKGEA